MSFDLRVGVAGCGRMGLGMARAMRAGGVDIRGFDVRPASEFSDFSDRMVEDAGAFAADLDVLMTVVRDIRQTEDVLFDAQAMLSRAPGLKYLVVSSTLSPRYLADLSSRLPKELSVVDAPMSGAQIAADEARLSFMLGGETADLDVLEPMFRTMGQKIHRMGGRGAGMTAKVLNNFIAATSLVSVRRVLDWADELGMDETRMLALMHDSSGQTWFGSGFEDIEFSRDGYDVENTIGIVKKDVESCLDAVDPSTHAGLAEAVVAAVAGLTPRAK